MSDKEDEKDTNIPPTSDSSKKRKLCESEAVSIPSTSEPHNIPPWVAGGSPAKFIAPDELLNMSVAMDNLALVHEIAIDPDYSISEAPSNPIESAVKESMRRAFWDLLKGDLSKIPPVYEHAFNLLLEIKQIILSEILTDRHVRLKSEIEMHLNETTLRNQLEQECLLIEPIGKFIIEFLSRLCAPARDSMIESLKKETGIVELLKGIFELLDVMKVDMANYTISANRAAVEEHSAKMELDLFLNILEKTPNGAEQTKKWLANAYNELYPIVESEAAAKRERLEGDELEDLVKITSKAYLRLILSEQPIPFPETMTIDKIRLRSLSEKYLQLSIVTTAVFVSCNFAGKEIAESSGFKQKLKNTIIVITNDIDESNSDDTIGGVTEQCIKEVKEESVNLKIEFNSEKEALLRSQLNAIMDKNNSVRKLVESRIQAFFEEMLCSPATIPRRLLPGLSVIERELCGFTAKFLRICLHNRKTFSDFYLKLITEIKMQSTQSSSASASA